MPDVAAHASMLPGWPVVIDNNWIEDAGTSASAPLVAGAFAVLSARERAAGRPPLGPVNGLLYARPGTIFDIVSGNNGYSPQGSRPPGQAGLRPGERARRAALRRARGGAAAAGALAELGRVPRHRSSKQAGRVECGHRNPDISRK